MRYSTPENWAEFLSRTEGVDIPGYTVRKRLISAKKIGIDGRIKIGRLLKGAFYSEVDVREVLADLLIKPEDKKTKAIKLLSFHGITDRESMLNFGVVKFMQADFPPFGKGTAFASVLLSETMQYMKISHLNLISDILGFPKYTEAEIMQNYKTALASHGITDRQSLLSYGVEKFMQTDFPPFGKGRALASDIIGNTFRFITFQTLEQISDIISFPKLSDILKQKFIATLASHGITDRQSLLAFGAIKFRVTDFPPFGKGKRFAKAVIGKKVRNVGTNTIDQIADILGFPKYTEAEIMQNYKTALASHGITDRQSMLNFGVIKFMQTDFPPFGKGQAFASLILGNTLRYVSLQNLERIADVLGFPKLTEEETKQQYKQALGANGIHDRQTLIKFGTKQFEKLDFHPFGKGSAFAGVILGETVGNVAVDHLSRIVDVLFGK